MIVMFFKGVIYLSEGKFVLLNDFNVRIVNKDDFIMNDILILMIFKILLNIFFNICIIIYFFEVIFMN